MMTSYELEVTIVSAKHLKNVNWRAGDIKPYCVFWVDPAHHLTSKCDDSGSTKPVWNERFSLPLPNYPASSSIFTLEVFHSNSSDVSNPLIGTRRIPLSDLPQPHDTSLLRSFALNRPSGRPHGKVKMKIGVRQLQYLPPHPHNLHQDMRFSSPNCFCYPSPTAPPPPRDYNRYAPVHSFSSSAYAPYPPPVVYFPGSGHYQSSLSPAAPPLSASSIYAGSPSAGGSIIEESGTISGWNLDMKHNCEGDVASSARYSYKDYRAD